MTAYATIQELRDTMDIGDSASDAQLQACLDAAATWIESDAGCARTFRLDTADSTKLYNPSCPGVLDVVDLVTVTSIKLDRNGDRTYSTTLTTSDYQLLPLNEPRARQLVSWPRSSYQFTPGQYVQVVGKFGYVDGGAINTTAGTTPDAVRTANLLLAARLYKRREAPFGVLGQVDLGQYQRISAADPDVLNLLEPYRRQKRWTVA